MGPVPKVCLWTGLSSSPQGGSQEHQQGRHDGCWAKTTAQGADRLGQAEAGTLIRSRCEASEGLEGRYFSLSTCSNLSSAVVTRLQALAEISAERNVSRNVAWKDLLALRSLRSQRVQRPSASRFKSLLVSRDARFYTKNVMDASKMHLQGLPESR